MTSPRPGPHPHLSDRAGLIIALVVVVGLIAFYIVAGYFTGLIPDVGGGRSD